MNRTVTFAFQMRQMGLCPPVEIAPVISPVVRNVPDVPEENEADEEDDEVRETDLEVRELFGDRQTLLPPPTRFMFDLTR